MLQRFLSFIATAKQVPERIRKALFTYTVTRSQLWKVKAELDTYRQALDLARNPLRYDRKYLYAMYREVELDDQVIAQGRIACATMQRAPFEVVRADGGKDDKALSDRLRKPWFFDLLEVLVKTEFWGHSLVEFVPTLDERGELSVFSVIPRDHVRPEYGDITLQLTDSVGVPYRDSKQFPYVLEIGRPDDLGLYHVVAIPYIRKKYADTDWSLFSERFGSPFLTIKTASRDQRELDAKERMARDFGSNGYAILDDQDELNTVVSNYTGTAHYTFRDRITLADDQIAKIMNGQTGASDEKAYVGSAEVHERILNDFNFSRMTRIQYFINFVLFPFLTRMGYPGMDGARFEFTELRRQEAKETTAGHATDDDETPPAPGKKTQKKSPRMNALALHYDPYFHDTGCACPMCRE